MCEPTLIVAAVSTVMQGVQKKQEGDFQSDVLKYNARNQENEATRIRNKGNEEEAKQRRATAELVSSQRASLGAAGVDIDSGSPLLLQSDTKSLGEVDALRIRQNYRDEARVKDDSALLSYAEARAKKKGGKASLQNSILSAAGQYFGSGVSDKWFNKDSAAFDSDY